MLVLLGCKQSIRLVVLSVVRCGHCKNLAPTFNKLADKYNKLDKKLVTLAKVVVQCGVWVCCNFQSVILIVTAINDLGQACHVNAEKRRHNGKRLSIMRSNVTWKWPDRDHFDPKKTFWNKPFCSSRDKECE